MKSKERLNRNCTVDKFRKRNGWMFWGSFIGFEKGPKLVWEKSWGTIDSEQYCKRIVPLIADEVSRRPGMLLMQDNAPPHSSKMTVTELRARGISTIEWPPCSPDLNPIESVWNQMKYFIEDKYPDLGEGRQRSSREIREIVEEAWESVSCEDLMKLLMTMPARCQAVLDADGGCTQY